MDLRTMTFSAAVLIAASAPADTAVLLWSTLGLAVGLAAGDVTSRRA